MPQDSTFDKDHYYGLVDQAYSLDDGTNLSIVFDVIRGQVLNSLFEHLPLKKGIPVPDKVLTMPARIIVGTGTKQDWANITPAPLENISVGSWVAIRLRRQGVPADLYVTPNLRRTAIPIGFVNLANTPQVAALQGLFSLVYTLPSDHAAEPRNHWRYPRPSMVKMWQA